MCICLKIVMLVLDCKGMGMTGGNLESSSGVYCKKTTENDFCIFCSTKSDVDCLI